MKALSFTLSAAMLVASAVSGYAQDGTEDQFRLWAVTPPMGWNSWDCYYSSVNEDIVLANAKYQAEHLLQYGWEYVVVDIRWYANHPSLGGGNYNQSKNPDCQLDEYGRYLPSPTRFPSAMTDGVNTGFKALADEIHELGLKFGIHIMRGVPKYILDNPSAYRLKGAEDTAWSNVYSSTTPACTWLQDNLTVRNNEYGQLYYNSIVDLYADWGVDFIKVDDMSRPFYTEEVQMLRNAIDQCGRPIVLSLSPGKTALTAAQSCLDMANQWRMMDDLWDRWSDVKAVFAEADAWTPYRRAGNYPDCDMLPLGHIAMTVADAGYCSGDAGRDCALSQDEQRTMMTLWSISQSPLFFGGDYTMIDDFTTSLITNQDVLRMHSAGVEATKAYDNDNGLIAWTSLDPASGDRHLALFYSDESDYWIHKDRALYSSDVIAYTTDGHCDDIDIELPEGTTTLVLVADNAGDGNSYDHGDWINPSVYDAEGNETWLTGSMMSEKYTDSYYNVIREDINVYGNAKMSVLDQTYDRGFSMDANALMMFTIPEGSVRFTAKAALDDSGIGQDGGYTVTSMRFMVFTADPRSSLDYTSAMAAAYSGLIDRDHPQAVEMEASVDGATSLIIIVGDAGDGFSYDRSDIINPILIDSQGNETSLTTLSYSSYSSDWGTLHINENVESKPLRVNGTTYSTGLGVNAYCKLVYDLPDGHDYKLFRALCGLDDSSAEDNPSATSGSSVEFMFFTEYTQKTSTFPLQILEYEAGQTLAVADLWDSAAADIPAEAAADGSLELAIPNHGTRLLRLAAKNRTQSNSISIDAAAAGYGEVILTVTLDGQQDHTSYVEITCDGKHLCSQKMADGTVAYYGSGMSGGEHQFQAFYSGTLTTAACVSDSVSIVIEGAGIESPVYSEADAEVSIDGRVVSIVSDSDATARIYGIDGMLRHQLSVKAAQATTLELNPGYYIVACSGLRKVIFIK